MTSLRDALTHVLITRLMPLTGPGVSVPSTFFVRSPSVPITIFPITSGLLNHCFEHAICSDVIRDDVGAQPPGGQHRPKYEAQEPEGGEPDIKQPPDHDLPDVDEDCPNT